MTTGKTYEDVRGLIPYNAQRRQWKNNETSAWPSSWSDTGEDENFRIHLEMEQTKTTTMANCKLKVEDFVPSFTEIESMGPTHFAGTGKQLVFKEIPTLVVSSLDKKHQWVYDKARTGVLFVVYSVVELILLTCCTGNRWTRLSTSTSQNNSAPGYCGQGQWKATNHKRLHGTFLRVH